MAFAALAFGSGDGAGDAVEWPDELSVPDEEIRRRMEWNMEGAD
jgi:hypothetical protein